MAGIFEIYLDEMELFRFRLKTEQGRVLIESRPYRFKSDVYNAIRSIRYSSLNVYDCERLATQDGQHMFVLKASDNEVVACSFQYETPVQRDVALRSVMVVGPGASLVEQELVA